MLSRVRFACGFFGRETSERLVGVVSVVAGSAMGATRAWLVTVVAALGVMGFAS